MQSRGKASTVHSMTSLAMLPRVATALQSCAASSAGICFLIGAICGTIPGIVDSYTGGFQTYAWTVTFTFFIGWASHCCAPPNFWCVVWCSGLHSGAACS